MTPSVNTPFEPRKFSAKHSEFLTLTANGVHSLATEQFKVVVEYPDGSSSLVNLQHSDSSDCSVRQTIEVQQSVAWSEPGPVKIYIGMEVRGGVESEDVRLLKGQPFLVVSNIRTIYIRPF